MSGLLRRLTRRRPATADETVVPTPASSEPAGAPAESPAETGGGEPTPAPADEQPTEVIPATGATEVVPAAGEQPTTAEPAPVAERAPVRDLPAGIDPAELAGEPAASASRGKLRRRLRYLRRVRELLLRDLGGFIFEIHRTAGGTPDEGQRRLVESKANRLTALDGEVRGLEARLGEPHERTVVREPGIGGLCPECGELHASDAHYCAHCGAPLDAKARARRDAAVQAAATPAAPAAEAAPASVLWAAGPTPRAQQEPAAEAEKTDPSLATSQWLALPKKADDEAVATRPAPQDEPPAPAGDPVAGEALPTGDEPQADEAPATGDEPPTIVDEPRADEAPAAGDEPRADEAPAAGDEPRADEPPAAGDEPKADEPPATGDEPTTDEPPTIADEPKDEAPAAAGDPVADEAAAVPKPKPPARQPRAKKPAADDEFAPNGKRDEDVPLPSPDPLGSPREQGS